MTVNFGYDGAAENVRGPGRTRDWWLDAKGRPALATTVECNIEVLHYLDPKTGQWRKLTAGDACLRDQEAVTPRGFVAMRSTTPFVLVESWSDRQPSVFLLYNRDTAKLSKVGESRPAIPASRMGQQALVHATARDGHPIPTWVTLPNKSSGKKLPMLVLGHGGCYVRNASRWNADSRFLAPRGYVVLERAFRGSTGYGTAHVHGGWKPWGLAMQDDIADAARWAIAEGIADPQRICIAGASFGAHATLMGLIRDPRSAVEKFLQKKIGKGGE